MSKLLYALLIQTLVSYYLEFAKTLCAAIFSFPQLEIQFDWLNLIES